MTLNEVKQLGDTGISRYNNVDAFLGGAASNPAVQNQRPRSEGDGAEAALINVSKPHL